MHRRIKHLSIIVLLLIIGYFGSMLYRCKTVNTDGDIVQTQHFDVFYRGIYDKEAESIANYLEQNYERVLQDLDSPPLSKIKAYVHPSRTEFNRATGLSRSTAIGTSRGPEEFHILWTNWFNSILPANPQKNAVHEFTHCIQLNILISQELEAWAAKPDDDFDAHFEELFATKYPQWFWEAVSIYEAKEVNRLSVNYGMRTGPSLRSMEKGIQIYNLGYTLIEYIVETWGLEVLPDLIRSYCDLEMVLGISEDAFEAGWKEFVDLHY